MPDQIITPNFESIAPVGSANSSIIEEDQIFNATSTLEELIGELSDQNIISSSEYNTAMRYIGDKRYLTDFRSYARATACTAYSMIATSIALGINLAFMLVVFLISLLWRLPDGCDTTFAFNMTESLFDFNPLEQCKCSTYN